MIPVFVGELNPYGGNPDHALYCRPRGSSGERLQRLVCGLHAETYLGFPRYNLCTGKWSAPSARAAANEILAAHVNRERHDVLVLLGRKVVGAFFGGPFALHPDDWPGPFETDFLAYAPLGGRATEREPDTIVALPHPSGLCREWNAPGAFERARALLRRTCPDVPWGELYHPEVP